MDLLDALARGIAYRDSCPPDDPVHDITDSRIMQLITRHYARMVTRIEADQ